MAANYQHLRAFHAIAVDGGVSRAARRLNVAQPTLSQQLKALEARHGATLFEDRKIPLRLTLAGRELFALTQKLFAVAADIDEMLGDAAGATGASIRLGSDNPFFAAKIVQLLRERDDGVVVHVRMGNARNVMQWLSDAQIDAALASDPAVDAAFSYEPLMTDQLACALPVGHPLSTATILPVSAFAGETLLTREATSKTRAFVERMLADASVAPRATIELQSRETIREGVALGLGLGVFFGTECPPDPRLVYRPIETPAGSYELRSYLVFQRDRRRSAAIRLLRASIGGLRGDQPEPESDAGPPPMAVARA